jgi:polysaccharide chain length determinant protein (PEP-CTERM system associated)
VLPGKKYTPEDYLLAAWRRKWLFVIPLVLASVAAFGYARWLPDRFKSEAQILIIPQQVPESFVKPTVSASLQDRLQVMSADILSRTRLEKLIDEFKLYPEEKQTMILEDVIQLMRNRDIKFNVPRGRGRRDEPTSFMISFEATNPRVAMQVTDRLAGLFVQANTSDRSLLAQQTSSVMQSELDGVRLRLQDQDNKLLAFRSANAGTLPSQVQSNLQMMESSRTQLQTVVDQINHKRDRIQQLDQLMADTTALAAATPRAPTPAGQVPTGLTAAEVLAQARADVQQMETRLAANHPDLRAAKARLAEIQKKAEAEAANPPLAGTGVPIPALPLAQQQMVNGWRAEHESLKRTLEIDTKEEQRLRGVLASLSARLDAVPKRELELAQLTRDYDTLQERYKALLAKSEDARIAANLEQRQIGQSFKTVDPASLPERPISPDRPRIILMGVGAGLALGVLLVGFLEYRDTSFRSRDDIITVLALPVLAVVPRMVTTGERRRIKRRRVDGLAATAALAILAVAVSAWKFRLLDSWGR